jgi:hypothetical protein
MGEPAVQQPVGFLRVMVLTEVSLVFIPKLSLYGITT